MARAGSVVRVIAVAKNTFREAVRNRAFVALTGFAVAFILFSLILSELTVVGQGPRVVVDFGLYAISLFAAATAILMGTLLVYKELEKKLKGENAALNSRLSKEAEAELKSVRDRLQKEVRELTKARDRAQSDAAALTKKLGAATEKGAQAAQALKDAQAASEEAGQPLGGLSLDNEEDVAALKQVVRDVLGEEQVATELPPLEEDELALPPEGELDEDEEPEAEEEEESFFTSALFFIILGVIGILAVVAFFVLRMMAGNGEDEEEEDEELEEDDDDLDLDDDLDMEVEEEDDIVVEETS